MGIITGGVIVRGNQTPGSKPRVTYVEAVPTDALVYTNANGGGVATNGDLASNVLTGFMYERTGVNIWTRIDTV